jgi:pSer/pThr/pTyr-binding forkhead associated (FHA) protein
MKFCKMCGSPLDSGKISCPSCGGQTPSGYKFCQHCGTPLAKAATPLPGPILTPAPAPAPALPGPVMIAASTPLPTPMPTSIPAPAPAASAPITGPGTRPANPTPLQAALTPPVEIAMAQAPIASAPIPIVPTSGGGSSADMAKTIIEMNRPSFMVEPVTPPPAEDAALQGAVAPAGEPPYPSTLVERPPSVSGAIVTSGPDLGAATTTPPAGGPVARLTPRPAAGKATLGPGAARSPAAAEPSRQPLARLVSVNRDGSDGATHVVNEESFDLGRTDGQLRFEDDPYLAERHCRFCIQNGRWVVQDLATCNGVYLRLRGGVELRGGERLLLGKQVFRYEWLSEQEQSIAPAVEGGVLTFGSPLRSPWARLRQLTVAGVYRDIYYLYRPEITLGREEGDLIFPDDEFMSRRHLVLTLAGAKAQAQDLGSSNGTYLQIREQCELAPGDMLRVGDQLLRFELA